MADVRLAAPFNQGPHMMLLMKYTCMDTHTHTYTFTYMVYSLYFPLSLTWMLFTGCLSSIMHISTPFFTPSLCFFPSCSLHLSPLTLVWASSFICSLHSFSIILFLHFLVLTSPTHLFSVLFLSCSSFPFPFPSLSRFFSLLLSFSPPLFDDLFSSKETHILSLFSTIISSSA